MVYKTRHAHTETPGKRFFSTLLVMILVSQFDEVHEDVIVHGYGRLGAFYRDSSRV